MNEARFCAAVGGADDLGHGEEAGPDDGLHAARYVGHVQRGTASQA